MLCPPDRPPRPCSTFSAAVKLSLLVLLGGIGLATVTDVQYNGLGLAYGLLAVLTTTTFQVQMKYVTKEKDLSGPGAPGRGGWGGWGGEYRPVLLGVVTSVKESVA